MFKKQGEKAQPEIVETACPVHGSRSTPAAVVTPEPAPSQERPKNSSRAKSGQNVLRDPLFWVALVISISVVSAFYWLKQGRIADSVPNEEWGARVDGLSPSDATVMEWRLILDELKQKHVGNWPDPPIHSELRAKERLGKFYWYRHRDREALKTLEAALQLARIEDPNSLGDWETWIYLCRLYNQNHEYKKTTELFDKLVSHNAFLRKAHRQVVDFQKIALEAYEATGQRAKAATLREMIEKSSKKTETGSLYEDEKDTKSAFCDVRYQDYDYSLHLLYEGKARQAVDRLQRLVQDDKAWREHSDHPQTRAKLIMMLAVACVAAEDWQQAEKVLPIALRLAEQQKHCPCCGNTKPTVYRAYSLFLAHQGKAADAAKYSQMAAVAQAAPMGHNNYGETDPDEKNMFAKSDLYASELESHE